MRRLTFFPVLCMAASAACSDGAVGPQQVDPRGITNSAEAAPFVARSLAVAMSDEGVQQTVKDAMRQSLVVEHKLAFGEFLATAPGQELVAAAARAVGVSRGEMSRIANLLPEMDFYVPVRQDRLDWRVGMPLAVGITLDQNAHTIEAFRTSGARFEFGSEQGAALFFLQPAESKGRRVHPQAAVDGPAIQDANDGEISLVVTSVDAAGNVTVLDYADLPMAFEAPVGVRHRGVEALRDRSLSANTTASPGTYLSWVQPFFADGVGACEPYTKNYYYQNGSSTVTEYRRTSWGGMPCDVWGSYIWDFYYGYPPLGYPLLTNVIRQWTSDKVSLRLYEDDTFSDDYYGQFDYFASTANGQVVNGYAKMTIATQY